MGIFESIFRNKIGMTPKSEVFNNHIEVYKKIIDDKNFMEQRALEELKKIPQWQLLESKKDQLAWQVRNGNISLDESISSSNQIDELMLKELASYIDRQNSDSIYGILKAGLNNLKLKYINLPNMKDMEFDFWNNIVMSSELAEISIVQITSGSDYREACKCDKIIRNYDVRRHFKR